MPITTRTLWLLASLSSGAWMATVAAQDAALPRRLSPASVSGTERAGLTTIGDAVWAAGPDYRAAFEADAVEFTPALGPTAPRTFALRLRVERIGRRGEGLDPVAPGRRRVDTDAQLVTYERTAAFGGFEERYEIRAEGVEQSFLFEHVPAGTGDLVVQLALDTELCIATSTPRSITFEHAGLGGVSIGAVVGIDGAGRRVEGRLESIGLDRVALSLPASFVDSATLPLVLDPLIGTLLPIAGGAHDRDPDVAWHEGLQRWLCCWETVISSNDVDVRAQLLDAAGAPVGAPISVRPGAASAQGPQLITVEAHGVFLVAFEERGDLRAVAIDGRNGTVGPVATLATQVSRRAGDFNADGYVDGADLLVWKTSFGGAGVAEVDWDPIGGITIPQRALVAPPSGHELSAPRVAPIVRDGAPDGALVVYEQAPIGGGNADCYALALDSGLNPSGAPLPLAVSPLDERNPSIGGDGNTWFVAWERTATSGDIDVGCAALARGRNGFPIIVGSLPVDVRPGDQLVSDVAWLGESVLLALRDEVRPASGTFRAVVRSLDPFGCTDCEGSFPIDPGGIGAEHVRIGTRFASGGDRDTALVAWDVAGASSNPRDVLAHLFRASDGNTIDVGGGCASMASIHAPCVRPGNQAFTIRTVGVEPNARTFLVVSWRRLGIALGPCLLVADPFAGVVLDLGTTDGNGTSTANIPIPNGPVLTQSPWWIQSVTASSGPYYQIELTNCQVVSWR